MNGIIGLALVSFFVGGLFLQHVYAIGENPLILAQGSDNDGQAGADNDGQAGADNDGQAGVTNPGPSSSQGTRSILNPLSSQTIPEFLYKILDVLLTFAIPIIVLYIMYAGYLFVTAAGNEGQISTAKNALLWAVVGGVIVLGAKLIVSVIQGTVAAF